MHAPLPCMPYGPASPCQSLCCELQTSSRNWDWLLRAPHPYASYACTPPMHAIWPYWDWLLRAVHTSLRSIAITIEQSTCGGGGVYQTEMLVACGMWHWVLLPFTCVFGMKSPSHLSPEPNIFAASNRTMTLIFYPKARVKAEIGTELNGNLGS